MIRNHRHSKAKSLHRIHTHQQQQQQIYRNLINKIKLIIAIALQPQNEHSRMLDVSEKVCTRTGRGLLRNATTRTSAKVKRVQFYSISYRRGNERVIWKVNIIESGKWKTCSATGNCLSRKLDYNSRGLAPFVAAATNQKIEVRAKVGNQARGMFRYDTKL